MSARNKRISSRHLSPGRGRGRSETYFTCYRSGDWRRQLLIHRKHGDGFPLVQEYGSQCSFHKARWLLLDDAVDSTAALRDGVDAQLHHPAIRECLVDDLVGRFIGPVIAELGHDDATVGNIKVEIGGTKVLGAR